MVRFVLLLLISFPLVTTLSYASTVTATGFYGRSAPNSFVINATISLGIADHDTYASGLALFADRFFIRLPTLVDPDNSSPTVLDFGNFVEGALLTYEATTSDVVNGTNYETTAQLRVTAIDAEIFDSIESGGQIPFDVCVLQKEASGTGLKDSANCQSTIVTFNAIERFDAVCDNPTIGGIGSPFLSLRADLQFPAQPVLVKQPGQCPSGMTNTDFGISSAYVILVNPTLGGNPIPIPANAFTGGASEPDAPDCTIAFLGGLTPGAAPINCVMCDPYTDPDTGDVFETFIDIPALLESQLVKDKVIQVKAVDTDDASVAFSELDTDLVYAVFATYQYGLKTSQCHIGTPGDNKVSFELLGETDTELGGECFVATVAYGSAEHPDLDTLRWFRDDVLMTQKAGRYLVSFYYAYGPQAAKWLKDKPALKTAVRWSLWPVVWGVRLMQWIGV
jgi:hypothetical protein